MFITIQWNLFTIAVDITYWGKPTVSNSKFKLLYDDRSAILVTPKKPHTFVCENRCPFAQIGNNFTHLIHWFSWCSLYRQVCTVVCCFFGTNCALPNFWRKQMVRSALISLVIHNCTTGADSNKKMPAPLLTREFTMVPNWYVSIWVCETRNEWDSTSRYTGHFLHWWCCRVEPNA